MSYRTAENYRYDERRDASIARSMSHAARIRLLRQLRGGAATVAELQVCHQIKRFSLAGHIRALILNELVGCTLKDSIPHYHLRLEKWPSWLFAYIDRDLVRRA